MNILDYQISRRITEFCFAGNPPGYQICYLKIYLANRSISGSVFNRNESLLLL